MALLLFMVPGDAEDIRKEYDILLNELATFNPEMLDKQRVLAITKCDLIDEELKEMLSENLPDDVPHVFISAATREGIQELKDILFKRGKRIHGVIVNYKWRTIRRSLETIAYAQTKSPLELYAFSRT